MDSEGIEEILQRGAYHNNHNLPLKLVVIVLSVSLVALALALVFNYSRKHVVKKH